MGVDLKVDVNVEGADHASKAFASASDGAKKFQDHAVQTKANWAQTFTAMAEGFRLMMEYGDKFAEALLEPIKLAAQQEEANYRLAASLKAAGQYTDENMKSMKEYAHQLQAVTGQTEENILSVLAANQTYGLNAEQSKYAAETAADLAYVMKTDLKTANEELLQLFQGHDRAIAKVIPGVKALTTAQEMMGKGLEYVHDQLKGVAEGEGNTLVGALQRMKVGFEDVLKSIGEAITQGFGGGESVRGLQGTFEEIKKVVDENKDALQKFGKFLKESAIDGFKSFVTVLAQIGPQMDLIAGSFETLGNVIKIIVTPFMEAIVAYEATKAHFEGNTEKEERLVGVLDRLKKSFHETILTKQELDEEMKNGGGAEEPTQYDSAARRASRHEVIADVATPAPKSVYNIKENKDQQAARIQLEAEIQQQILAMQAPFTDALLAEQEARDIALEQKQQEALAKANPGKWAELNLAFDKLQDAQDEFYAHKRLERDLQVNQQIAEQTGRTREAIEAGYQNNLDKYTDMLKQRKNANDQDLQDGYISEQQHLETQLGLEKDYLDQVNELRRKADQANLHTTGSAELDEDLQTANAFVSAAQSGVAGIVSQIGSMFGPIGELISSLVNFFNVSPAEFEKFLDGLIQAFKMLPVYIAQNIPIFIEKLIAAAPQIVIGFESALNDPRIWINAARAFARGLGEAIASVFTGQAFKAPFETAASSAGKALQKSVGFGSDDPNAAGSEFKIKDAVLAGQRKAAGSFEDTFPTVVDEAGKSLSEYFVDALRRAFDGIFNTLGDWGTKIWEGLSRAATGLFQWGQSIWQGIWVGLSSMGQFFVNLGIDIWVGLYNAVGGGFERMYELGRKIFDGLLQPISAGLFEPFYEIGHKIWDGFTQGITGAWDWIKSIGVQIAQGFLGAIPGVGGAGGGLLGTVLGVGGSVVSAASNVVSSLNPFHDGGYVSPHMSQPAVARALDHMGALHFASGGTVPGTGFDDSVPAIVRPGERVLTPEQQQGQGDQINVTFQFNVESGGKLDKEAAQQLAPHLIEILLRESRKGRNILRPSGVY